MAGELPLGHRHLADRRASSAELLGHGEREVARVPQDGERLADEGAISVVIGDVGPDLRAELRRPFDQLALSVCCFSLV